MAYRGIDRKRYQYLLGLGADQFELRRFFIEKQKTLIMNKGRVQNLPHGQESRLRVLAFELPSETDVVVQAWFAKNLTMVDPDEPEKVVEEFKLYEEHKENIPEENAKRLSRSCLVHLFKESPPDVIMEFLKSPIGGEKNKKTMAEPVVPQAGSQVPKNEVMTNAPSDRGEWKSLSRVLVKLLEGQDVDEDLSELPPDLGTFIAGLQATMLGNHDEAKALANALSMATDLQLNLEAFQKRVETRTAGTSTSLKGFVPRTEVSFSGDFFPEGDAVLGYCTSARVSSAVFVKPLAVVRGSEVLFLSESEAERTFPETGSIMSFQGIGKPRQPTRGDIGIWQVAEHDTDKRTRFHLATEKRPVFEAMPVPFPSTDHDSVRTYLMETPPSTQLPRIYQLSDGLILAPRPERPDLGKEETFEHGLLAWESLPAIRLDGRLLVLGPLPQHQSVYECGSLASTAKSLFRRKDNGIGAGLTRTQLRELAESLGAGEPALTEKRIGRLRAELLRLAEQREALDILVSHIAQREEVQVRIDALVEAEAEKKASMRIELQTDIARLQSERAEWEERIRRQKEENKKAREETTKVVRGAFDKALKEGMPKLLAEAAIVQALVPASASVPATTHLTATANTYRAFQRELMSSEGDSVSVLRKFGIGRERIEAFTIIAKVAKKAGLILSIKGSLARPIVEAWANTLGGRIALVDVSVGQIEDEPLRALLQSSPALSCVVLFDANLSALDIYARPLTDLAVANIAQTTSIQFPGVFLVLSDGLGALPVPRAFEQLCVAIDLDRQYEFHDSRRFDDFGEEIGSERDYPSLSLLWELGAQRLIGEIKKLSTDDKALVLSVLLA